MRLLTHNVYWFQGSPSRWGRERVAAAAEVSDALVRLYADTQADVFALQEVHESALAKRLAVALDCRNWLHASGGHLPEYGGALLTRHDRGRLVDQTRTGNARHERCHLRASLPDGVGALEVAAVHLPSNRRAARAEAGEVLRVAELKRVLAVPPRPDVVMGDFNSLPGSGPYRWMVEAGYIDAASEVDAPPLRWRARVDYIWLAAALLPRLRDYRVLDEGPFERIDAAGAAWRLSDHPPLLVELAGADSGAAIDR